MQERRRRADDTVTIHSVGVRYEDRAAATLAVGDTISLRDLLLALVSSEGDAAVAVGTYIGERVYTRLAD